MMGTGPFAVPAFQWLLGSTHDVLALVTRPVPPTRRRSQPPVSPVREVAVEQGLPVLMPPDVNATDFHANLQAFSPDLLVVCDFGQILSRESLGIAPLGGINLHGSLLPQYRGAAPVNYAIWNGDRETGVTAIHMTPRLDAGPVVAVCPLTIGDAEDAVSLETRLADRGAACLEDALRQLEHWDGIGPLGVQQDNALASRAPRLKKTDGLVDWQQPAERIYNQVRALKPWPGSFTFLPQGEQTSRLILHQVAVEQGRDEPVDPGVVVHVDRHQLWVGTGRDLLSLQRVQLPGKRAMEVSELLQGHTITTGVRFVND